MGIRGEIFSDKVVLDKRTYFFNVKENRLGDVFMTVVESKPSEGEGFDRHQVVLFADDVREFLKGFESALGFMEKEALKRRKAKRELGLKRELGPKRDAGPKRELGPKRDAGSSWDASAKRSSGERREGPSRGAGSGKRLLVTKKSTKGRSAYAAKSTEPKSMGKKPPKARVKAIRPHGEK